MAKKMPSVEIHSGYTVLPLVKRATGSPVWLLQGGFLDAVMETDSH
jgi:hypothetical protein